MSLEFFVNGKGPEALLQRVSACLASAGTDGFEHSFRDLCASVVRADECTVYSRRSNRASDRPVCYMAIGEDPDLDARVAGYIQDGYRQDPVQDLIPRVRDTGVTQVVGLAEMRPRMPADFLDRFYTRAGLADAITVLGRDQKDLVSVTFARTLATGPFTRSDPELRQPFWETIVRMVLLHYSNAPVGDDPLAILSVREQAICRAMLRGLTEDAIAWETGLSPSTVKTYRRRAYEKLGINSKPALFALCQR